MSEEFDPLRLPVGVVGLLQRAVQSEVLGSVESMALVLSETGWAEVFGVARGRTGPTRRGLSNLPVIPRRCRSSSAAAMRCKSDVPLRYMLC
jgi:hypothetical protein